jgi:hypothetical protein
MNRGRKRCVPTTRSMPLQLNNKDGDTSLGSQVAIEIDVQPCQMMTQGPSNASCKCTYNIYAISSIIEQTTSPKITN